MLYITFICIAYIIGIIWGLCLTKVGLSPLIFIIIAILVFLKKYPHIEKWKISFMVIFIFLGLINYKFRINDFEYKYKNKEVYSFTGYIDRFISSGEKYNKFIFTNEYNDKFIIYINNKYNINEDIKISFRGSFLKPSHARNQGRI